MDNKQDTLPKDTLPKDTLPIWDLSDFYAGFADKALAADVEKACKGAQNLAKKYKPTIDSLSGDEIAEMIEEWEQVMLIVGKVMSFAQLSHTVALEDEGVGRAVQNLRESLQEVIDQTLFIDLAVKKWPADFMERGLQQSETLRSWQNWLKDEREWSAHTLSDEVEAYIQSTSVVSKEAWNRLFDETMARLRTDVEGKSLTLTETLHLFSDRQEKNRKAAFMGLRESLDSQIPLLTHITNTLVKMKSIQDDKRGFTRPDASRHKSNLVAPEIVDACVSTVKEHYGVLSHRYYQMKAKWLGEDKLSIWNRLAPPPGREGADYIPWDRAVEEVLEGFGSFSPLLGDIALKFFDPHNSWIDAKPREGKASGAFSASTVPSVHPYILLNYQGKKRDVMTLAHELGHGVHQYLAGNAQGYFRSSTPLTLAETASVFGEMIVFQRLRKNCKDDAEKFYLLAHKIEDMLATVVRQISFYDFEYRLHQARRKSALTSEEIHDIWCAVSRESLGPSVDVDHKLYGCFWSYVPHFIHTPFYVYSYAFGDCLVNGLYRCYVEGLPDFVHHYEEMLRKGGSVRHQELLAPFGIDLRDGNFWKGSLAVIGDLMDELERMEVPDFDG